MAGFVVALLVCTAALAGAAGTLEGPPVWIPSSNTAWGKEGESGLRKRAAFAGRDCDTVCRRWTADFPATATQSYIADTGCGIGSIDAIAHTDAMRRVNLFRWLVGLNEVNMADSTSQIEAQSAAKMMDANNDLSHFPPTTWTCYTTEGANGAKSSNLALGYSSAATSVDGYMVDANTPSLGHRRWIINSRQGCTCFGHYNRGGAMKVFSFGSSTCATPTGTGVDFVAFPPPGDVPVSSLRGVWSFATTGGRPVSNATVSIKNLATNAVTNPTTSVLPSGFGDNTISFGNPSYVVNEPLEITVTLPNSSPSTVVYVTQIVDCNSACPVALTSSTGVASTSSTTGIFATTSECVPLSSCPDPLTMCGNVPDGCGTATVPCGGCTGNQTLCIGNTCTCQPATCASLGYECGSYPDGCGNTTGSCGVCTSSSCVDGTCASVSCGGLNETCAKRGYDCANFTTTCTGDGSEVLLRCGTCAPNFDCVDNKCACTPLTKTNACTDSGSGQPCGSQPDGCNDFVLCDVCPGEGSVCLPSAVCSGAVSCGEDYNVVGGACICKYESADRTKCEAPRTSGAAEEFRATFLLAVLLVSFFFNTLGERS